MVKRFKSLFVALLIISLSLSLAGCKKSEPQSGSQTSQPAVSSSQVVEKVENKGPVRPELLSEGQKAVFKDVEVTLLGSRKATEHTRTPREGEGYIVLKFRIKNLSDEEMYGDKSSDLQWMDKASDRRNGYERTTGVDLNNPENKNLASGQEAEFEAVYMVPLNLTEVEFHYVPGYDPIEKARWKVMIK